MEAYLIFWPLKKNLLLVKTGQRDNGGQEQKRQGGRKIEKGAASLSLAPHSHASKISSFKAFQLASAAFKAQTFSRISCSVSCWQCWEGYFANAIGSNYKLLLKCNSNVTISMIFSK